MLPLFTISLKTTFTMNEGPNLSVCENAFSIYGWAGSRNRRAIKLYLTRPIFRRHNTQHSDIQLNNTLHNTIKCDTQHSHSMVKPGNTYKEGMLITVDLLFLISLDQQLLIMRTLFTFYKKATLIRSSTVLSLPFQLVFPGNSALGCLSFMVSVTIKFIMLSVVMLNWFFLQLGKVMKQLSKKRIGWCK